jgi:hypothetical protein
MWLPERTKGWRKAEMNHPRPNPAVRLLPSLTDVAFLMPILFVFLRMEGAPRLLEGDTGWHIRTGEWILQNGRVPDRDIFSFTKPGEPWFAWEWLWDVAFAWLHMHGGMAAVILATLLVLCLTMALLFRLTLRKCDNVFIAFGVTWLATAASSVHWWARPHVFTLLFAVVSYSILERAHDGRKTLLWILPFLTILWTNLHGGFFIGIVLIGAYAAAELAGALIEEGAKSVRSLFSRISPYVLAGLGCAVASLLNPYSYQLHIHILKYLTDPYHFRHINEFQSVSFHAAVMMYFEVLIILGVAAAVWSIKTRQFVYAILIVAWLHGALVSGRNIPIYAIVSAPVIALAARDLLRALSSGGGFSPWIPRAVKGVDDLAAEFGSLDRLPRWHAASLAGFLAVAALCYAPTPPKEFRAEYDPKTYPTEAIAFLDRVGFTERVFTNDEWGDYLIYRLYPKARAFVDGRSDFYGGDFGKKYLDVMNVKHTWQEHLDRYAIDTVLLPVDAALAAALKESSRWRPVFDDGIAIVFRPAGAGAAAAETSSIVSSSGRFRVRSIGSDPSRDRRITQIHIERRKPL